MKCADSVGGPAQAELLSLFVATFCPLIEKIVINVPPVGTSTFSYEINQSENKHDLNSKARQNLDQSMHKCAFKNAK